MRIKLSILILIAGILLSTNYALAQSPKETITWLYFNFPPIFEINNGKKTGLGFEIMNRLQTATPEYTHEEVLASPRRMIEELSRGKNVLVLGMLKTPDREKTMLFSKIPARLTSPHIAIRKGSQTRLFPDGKIRIRELTQNPTLTFGRVPHITYGPTINSYIEKATCQIHNVTTQEGLMRILLMLSRGRVDWTMAEPFAAYAVAKKLGVENDIEIVPIADIPHTFLTGHMVAPKTDWGARKIEQYDAIMTDLIRSDEHFRILAKYCPVNLLRQFKREYNQVVRKLIVQK